MCGLFRMHAIIDQVFLDLIDGLLDGLGDFQGIYELVEFDDFFQRGEGIGNKAAKAKEMPL